MNNAFEDDFGYSAGGDSYKFIKETETLKSNIRNGQPVILSGCRTQHLGGLWYSDCHAWVCDGYQTISNDCYRWLYLHMNWGWDGRNNDWYGYSSWTPETRNYRYDQDVIVNIHP